MSDLIPEVRIIVQLKDRIRELEATLNSVYSLMCQSGYGKALAIIEAYQSSIAEAPTKSAKSIHVGSDMHGSGAETKAEPCEHDWSPVGIPEGVFQCTKCGEIG